MRNPDLALRTHAREELGIDPSATGSPWIASSSSFLFFSVGAIIPLLPWIIAATGNVMWWSVGLAGAATLFVGGAVGHFTRRGIAYSALRALIIMAVASAVTYGVGALVGR
jgi:VIT1/CCC1 family predicted Fe2+/Mn2+ transporter